MRRVFLYNAISFLSGVLWTLMGVSTFFVFVASYHVGIVYALGMSLVSMIFWLFWIVIIEMANIQLQKLDEMRKQTELLRSIDEKISHHRS